MDDRGSGWPGDERRLAWIEDGLARLQADITQLREILPKRLKSDPRTPWEIGSSRVSTGEPPVTAGRRGSLEPRFRSDAIGGVEKQLTTLRGEVERLLRLVQHISHGQERGPSAHPDSDVRLGGTFARRHHARGAPWGNANR